MIEVPEGGTERNRPLALVAEPQDWAGRALGSLLAPEGYSVVHARDGAEALDRVTKLEPDMVVSNVRLPDMAGAAFCRAVRSLPDVARSMPLVVTASEALPRSRRLELIRAGAWDCFHLPAHAEELPAKLSIFLEAKREVDRYRDAGLVDPETGLYNVHGLLRRVREAGTEASRFHRPMACVVLAPDFATEDMLGGNGKRRQAVANVVDALRNRCRGSDSLARLGKTQFTVLAPSTNGSGARGMARRLMRGLEAELRSDAAVGDPDDGMVRLRAGVYAVSDFGRVTLDPVEVLARATIALRRSQADPSGEAIRIYEGDGGGSAPPGGGQDGSSAPSEREDDGEP